MRPPHGGAGGEPPETDMSMRLSRSIVGEAEAEAVQAKYEFVFRSKILDFYRGKPLTL